MYTELGMVLTELFIEINERMAFNDDLAKLYGIERKELFDWMHLPIRKSRPRLPPDESQTACILEALANLVKNESEILVWQERVAFAIREDWRIYNLSEEDLRRHSRLGLYRACAALFPDKDPVDIASFMDEQLSGLGTVEAARALLAKLSENEG